MKSDKSFTPEDEIAPLRDENGRLRDELWHQWQYNHSDHCRTEWPHPVGKDCYWPLPDVLGRA